MSEARKGAFVVSLDFELHWGVRDHRRLDALERSRLLSARAVVPGILDAFRDHEVRATWATVGLLFAHGREEALAFRPMKMPRYEAQALDPYSEQMGRDEAEDPFHFAPSLIRTISSVNGQEIGSHSYSHYYALEAGQGVGEFEADLLSATRIANNSGYTFHSFVFPRNQVSQAYLPVLRDSGFSTYRGTEPARSKAPGTFQEQRSAVQRAMRLVDAYSNLHGAQLGQFPSGGVPFAINASRYLRPYSPALQLLERVRLKRIESAMRSAATGGQIFHLWWHPEDFAGHPNRNLEFLRKVLQCFEACRRDFGMESLSMADVSEIAQRARTTVDSGVAV